MTRIMRVLWNGEQIFLAFKKIMKTSRKSSQLGTSAKFWQWAKRLGVMILSRLLGDNLASKGNKEHNFAQGPMEKHVT